MSPLVTNTPTPAPARSIAELRCGNCRRKLAELVTSPWRIVCPRCKAINTNR